MFMPIVKILKTLLILATVSTSLCSPSAHASGFGGSLAQILSVIAPKPKPVPAQVPFKPVPVPVPAPSPKPPVVINGIGDRIAVASSGHVFAQFLGHSTSFYEALSLSSPVVNSSVFNTNSIRGSSVDLGFFTAGTELSFALFVQNTGHTYFTGLASANPDGRTHARLQWNASQRSATIGFEDSWRSTAPDYNDFRFSLTNVVFTNLPVTAVPEPSAWILLLGGLIVLGVIKQKNLKRTVL